MILARLLALAMKRACGFGAVVRGGARAGTSDEGTSSRASFSASARRRASRKSAECRCQAYLDEIAGATLVLWDSPVILATGSLAGDEKVGSARR